MSSEAPLTCDAFLDRAWAEHGERSRAVAEQLLTSLGVIKQAAEIPHYAALVVHVFGEHLGEWREGIELLARLSELDCFEESGEAATALHRAVTTLELAATGDTAPLSALAISERVRVLAVAASALSARDELGRAGSYFHQALAACNGVPPSDPAHRALAVTSNNLAVSLEDKTSRTAADIELMLLAARTARREWEIAGTWLNVERAEYRLAMSCLAAKRPELARAHANACVALCLSNGAPPIELLGAHEALALAEHGRKDLAGLDVAIEGVRQCVAQVDAAERGDCEQRLSRLLDTLAAASARG